jgi:aspartyl-tRNA(Asn)/glutamyl-tRNA(Gln) amidotransferase subunit C
MALTRSEVENIAHLARLAIGPEEIPLYVKNLSRILDFVRQLEAVDTRGVQPMAHPLALNQRLRPDQITEHDEHSRYQANAPLVEAGLYLVPKVID